MNRNLMISALAAATLAMGVSTAAQADDGELRIGVLAKRGAAKCLERWTPTANYLEQQLDRKVTIYPLAFTEIEPKVKAQEIDFVLANSAFYVGLEKQYGVKAVCSLINSRQGKELDTFGGVILVAKDSPIQQLEDLKGKKFMCVKYSSFGGAHMAWRLLLENGIDPEKDFAEFLEGKKHDNVVLAVKAGVVDAGTVRSDTLERMEAEGKIKLADFRIINKIEDEFPFVHSTQLYPEWPMAACAHTAGTDAEAVAQALTALKKDDEASKAASIIGWVKPLDYKPVVECLTAIKYGPFADSAVAGVKEGN